MRGTGLGKQLQGAMGVRLVPCHCQGALSRLFTFAMMLALIHYHTLHTLLHGMRAGKNTKRNNKRMKSKGILRNRNFIQLLHQY